MHYIVGVQFTKSGRSYSLYNIVRKDDGVEYTFNESSGGEPLVLLFDSTQAGDRYIASL